MIELNFDDGLHFTYTTLTNCMFLNLNGFKMQTSEGMPEFFLNCKKVLILEEIRLFFFQHLPGQ